MDTGGQDQNVRPHSQAFPHATINVPSLYPGYLPYSTQHRLLVQLQEGLERACYDFARRRMKEIIANEGWTCPESVELNIWAKVLLSNPDRFPEQEMPEFGRPLADILNSASHIRHTAVHRLRITVNRIENFVSDAELLARLLQDELAAVEDMVSQDEEYQQLAGTNLEQIILAPETAVQSAAPTENETASETELEVDH